MNRSLALLLLAILSLRAPCETFQRYAVAADHPLASQAGASILAQGGNAVDAAVATSFALSVVRPYSTGIGGGGFMVIKFAGDPTHADRAIALNYRETCPAAITPDFYNDLPADAPRTGGTAVATPAAVLGLLHALETYGTMDRAAVLAPAIALAEDGFDADDHYARAAANITQRFLAEPQLQTRFAFTWQRYLQRGEVRTGSRIRNPEQALALRLIARDGAAAFYEGAIARAIVDAVRADGGVLSMRDLADVTVETLEPRALDLTLDDGTKVGPRGRIRGSWTVGGHHLVGYTMPLPSSGGVAIDLTLRIIGALDGGPTAVRAALRSSDPAGWDTLAQAMMHAFADRARYLADPAFAALPLDQLITIANVTRIASLIADRVPLAPESYGTPGLTLHPRNGALWAIPEDGGTSHFSIIDAHGNAVACTETINTEFGALLPVPEFGFCLNNQMDDFTTARGGANQFGLRQSDANLPEPGKRPLSSMSPTIVTRIEGEGRDRTEEAVVVAGASGGPRIITATLQAILRVTLAEQTADQAVRAPRIHHQWAPPILFLDPSLMDDDDLRAALAAMGHDTAPIQAEAAVQLIRRAPDGTLDAACDPRKGGAPAGR